MSLKKVILSTVAAATLTTGAMATVTIEANHIGNDLKFPVYFALEGANWKTNFRVINTNTTKSIVAKVVIREGKQSAEKLDFLVYLSPTDVFDATIHQVGANIVLTTYDDSIDLNIDSEIAGNSRVSRTADGEGIDVTFVQDYTAPDSIGQNSTYGYVEVYGLMENRSTAVKYNTKGDGMLSADDLDVDLATIGVDHTKFVQAASGLGLEDGAGGYTDKLDRKSAAAMAGENWNQVTNGLTGKAVILGNNQNGQLAMAYTAVALLDDTASAGVGEGAPIAVVDNALLPASQRGKDTNFLTRAGGDAFIEDIENALSKQATFVVHYDKDGKTETEANAVGTMSETTMVTNFITKKYSVEMWNNYFQPNAAPTTADTHGINSAGGNLFYAVNRGSVDSSLATSADGYNDVVRRYAKVIASKHNHFEYKAAAGSSDGTSGTIPGEVAKELEPCYTELCLISMDSNAVDGVASASDITDFGNGYVTMQFEGSFDRDATAKVYHMPYIPMVMTGVTIEGTNITNISYPAYLTGNLETDRTGKSVTKYAADIADVKYDDSRDIGNHTTHTAAHDGTILNP